MTNAATEDRTHVWIISLFQGECAECSDVLARGAHILWLPKAPRGENNYCAPCGTDITGSYPPQSYWDRREANAREKGRL
jgi:hypothetical protein